MPFLGHLVGLFQFNLTTCIFELCFQLVGFFAWQAFLDRAWSFIHHRFGFFEAKSCYGAYFLNHGNFVTAYARQDHVKFGLLFATVGAVATASTRSSNRYACRSRFDVVFFFEVICKFAGFFDREANELFSEFLNVCHKSIRFLQRSVHPVKRALRCTLRG